VPFYWSTLRLVLVIVIALELIARGISALVLHNGQLFFRALAATWNSLGTVAGTALIAISAIAVFVWPQLTTPHECVRVIASAVVIIGIGLTVQDGLWIQPAEGPQHTTAPRSNDKSAGSDDARMPSRMERLLEVPAENRRKSSVQRD